MNILELTEKSRYDVSNITARKVAENIMGEMEDHIGINKSITRRKLFVVVFGVEESKLKPLNQFLLKDLLYQAITYLRKKTNCFIVAHRTPKGWEYFIPTTMAELKTYKRYTAERIKSLQDLEKRAEKSVRERWYEQEWEL